MKESGDSFDVHASSRRADVHDGPFLASEVPPLGERDRFSSARGAECVILGCTEIPLIITAENSSLPILDSTRLLARDAVRTALAPGPLVNEAGWLQSAGAAK